MLIYTFSVKTGTVVYTSGVFIFNENACKVIIKWIAFNGMDRRCDRRLLTMTDSHTRAWAVTDNIMRFPWCIGNMNTMYAFACVLSTVNCVRVLWSKSVPTEKFNIARAHSHISHMSITVSHVPRYLSLGIYTSL